MKIVLPYVGSKQRFFKLLKDNIPKDHLYIEPFAGGFSLGLALLDKELVEKAILNDLDQNVANFWALLKKDYWSLVTEVDMLIALHNSLIANHTVKEVKAELEKTVVNENTKTALFYLYKKMNMGTSRQIIKADLTFGKMEYTETFYTASKLLKNVVVTNENYTNLKVADAPKTLWYLDPPYVNAKNSDYYAQCSNEDFNHIALANFLRGIEGKFILSYDDCPLVNQLYTDYNIHHLHVPSSLNAKGYSEEVVISNFPLTLGELWSYRQPRTKQTTPKDIPITLSFADLLEDD
jgi:DNA adenine methylase